MFARAQVDAGADTIGIGDAIASQVNPRIYERPFISFIGFNYKQTVFAAPGVPRSPVSKLSVLKHHDKYDFASETLYNKGFN